MIRLTTPDDTIALIALADATGLFESEQLEELGKLLSDYFSTNDDNDSLRDGKAGRFWLTDDDNGVVGVAYCEMEQMTDRTWNLQLLAIHPDCQGQGHGTKLLRYVEQTLTARSGRVLLVETSGTPDFDRTRAFYHKCGYEEEARIRDFYTDGADKIVYRKVLSAQEGNNGMIG
ncbi:MAG: GNAT family N-acetyltransferase [Fischerella sp. CENA71]|nr:GNAT family N-acetyltransferase [Fischerella sp. CENA71]